MSDALGVMIAENKLFGALVEKEDLGVKVHYHTVTRGDVGADEQDFRPGRSDPEKVPDEGEKDVSLPDEVDEDSDSGGFAGGALPEASVEITGVSDDGDDSDGINDGWDFHLLLQDLLSHYKEKGFRDPRIVFCNRSTRVNIVEVTPEIDVMDESGDVGISTSRVETALSKNENRNLEDKGEIGYIRMTEDGGERILALIPASEGSVEKTLTTIEDQTLTRLPDAVELETEIALYLGIARRALPVSGSGGAQEDTSIVLRCDSRGSLALIMKGEELHHVEEVPRLTSEDRLDRIGKRVRLLSDEHATGKIDHVLVNADEGEGIVGQLELSFEQAQCRRLDETLSVQKGPVGQNAAVGAALSDIDTTEAFPPESGLLPSQYKHGFRLPFGWGTIGMFALLVLTTVASVWMYFIMLSAIQQQERKHKALQREVKQIRGGRGVEERQAEIDSLSGIRAEYDSGNQLISGLLRGSNKWSRAMAELTSTVDSIEGVRIQNWVPNGNETAVVQGRARTRMNALQLTKSLGGSLQTIQATEERDVQLYNFQFAMPLYGGPPEVSQRQLEFVEAPQKVASRGGRGPETEGPGNNRPDDGSRASSSGKGKGSSGKSTSSKSGSAEGTSGEVSTAESASKEPGSGESGVGERGGSWTVVLGSFRAETHADAFVDVIRGNMNLGSMRRVSSAPRPQEVPPSGELRSVKEGSPVFVWQGDQTRLNRVGVGTYETFDAAKQVRKKVQARIEGRDDISSLTGNVWIFSLSPEEESS
jgi:Tfp pilus assembly protein PilN